LFVTGASCEDGWYDGEGAGVANIWLIEPSFCKPEIYVVINDTTEPILLFFAAGFKYAG